MDIATLPRKGLKTSPYSMDMSKRNLKTSQYSIDMSKRDLKTRPYSIDIEKKYLKKLTKGQLIKLLINQRKKPIPPPRAGKWESVKPKPVPRKSVKQMVKEYEDIIQPPDGYRPIPKPRTDKPPLPPTPNHKFKFDDDIFQTGNQSLGKFKIISIQSRENKKFKSYTNEFKVKILKELDDVKEIYHIFQKLVKTVKRGRKLSDNNMLRLVIQNEELPDAISTKCNKVGDFKLGDLENIINILEY